MTKFRRAHHEDLQFKAKSVGSHFFDADTMRLFDSRMITESVYKNDDGTVWYFATSEKAQGERRRYTARVARLVSGEQGEWMDVDTVDGTEFQQFSTRRQVNEFIYELVYA